MDEKPYGSAAGKSEYRPSIDGLRAVAVLLVIGFHVFPKAIAGGFVGVDVFFVISGFLISTILYREFGSRDKNGGRVIAGFYGRRIKRIFPSLAVVLAACYVLGFKALFPEPFKALCQSIVASVGFCLNLVASRDTGYFAGDAASKPLLHIWSLGVEEQFYLVWPLVIWVTAKARIRLLPVVVFLAGCSFFMNYYRMGASAAESFYLPQMRFWELSIGSIAAIAYPIAGALLAPGPEVPSNPPGDRSRWARWLPHAIPVVGICLIGAGALFVKKGVQHPRCLDAPSDTWSRAHNLQRRDCMVQQQDLGAPDCRLDRIDQLPTLPLALATSHILAPRSAEWGHHGLRSGSDLDRDGPRMVHVCLCRDAHPARFEGLPKGTDALNSDVRGRNGGVGHVSGQRDALPIPENRPGFVPF